MTSRNPARTEPAIRTPRSVRGIPARSLALVNGTDRFCHRASQKVVMSVIVVTRFRLRDPAPVEAS